MNREYRGNIVQVWYGLKTPLVIKQEMGNSKTSKSYLATRNTQQAAPSLSEIIKLSSTYWKSPARVTVTSSIWASNNVKK